MLLHLHYHMYYRLHMYLGGGFYTQMNNFDSLIICLSYLGFTLYPCLDMRSFATPQITLGGGVKANAVGASHLPVLHQPLAFCSVQTVSLFQELQLKRVFIHLGNEQLLTSSTQEPAFSSTKGPLSGSAGCSLWSSCATVLWKTFPTGPEP